MNKLTSIASSGARVTSIGHHCLVIARVDRDGDELTARHLDRDGVPVIPCQQDVALAGLDLLRSRVGGGELGQCVD